MVLSYKNTGVGTYLKNNNGCIAYLNVLLHERNINSI